MFELKELIIVALENRIFGGKYELSLLQLKRMPYIGEMKLFLHSFRYNESNFKKADFLHIVQETEPF